MGQLYHTWTIGGFILIIWAWGRHFHTKISSFLKVWSKDVRLVKPIRRVYFSKKLTTHNNFINTEDLITWFFLIQSQILS